MSVIIKNVIRGSLADESGIRPGDIIKKINGKDVYDYLDYMYLSANEKIIVELSNKTITIKNPEFRPLGAEFDTLLIDNPRSCRNKCIFCFIDQLPPNMRESCYFKDDDYRLSFLQGNYVTLTNMSDEDINRIIEYNIPRINVSVHTTNPKLRCEMLNNKFAGRIMEQMQQFSGSGMMINCQIVLCPGYNDGAELDRTISDILNLGDAVESLSVVPVGISAYRDGLTPLDTFDKKGAREVIKQVSKWQKKIKAERDINFVYLADEFYITAEEEIPSWQEYDGFPQIENGVGLCSSLKWEFEDALEECPDLSVKTSKTVATGVLAYGFINDLVAKLKSNKINVFAIQNNFFGKKITVSGLVTANDIIEQLKGKILGDKLLIPISMLRHDEDVFLDNLTVSDVAQALNVKVEVVDADGFDFLAKLLG